MATSNRMLRINEQLLAETANLLNEVIELRNALISISSLVCSPDLKKAIVYISVLPDKKSGSALRELRKKSSLITKLLNKKLNLKKIPRLNWQIDENARHANEIEKILLQINEEK